MIHSNAGVSEIQEMPIVELEHPSRLPAVIGGTVVAAVMVVLTLIGTAVLAGFGILAILAGIVLSLTCIGAIIGLPLLFLGLIALMGAMIGGAGGIFFALLLGAGVGYLYYRRRMRALVRARQR